MAIEQENVTLSLPADVLREARHLAVDRGVSLSEYVSELLEAHVSTTGTYEQAKERGLKRLREGMPYRMPEKITWTRDDLHDRSL